MKIDNDSLSYIFDVAGSIVSVIIRGVKFYRSTAPIGYLPKLFENLG